MMLLRRCLALAAMVVLLASASPAWADGYGYGIGNCWFGNLNAFGSSGTLYGSGYLPVPPYYAVHPPVYYSHPYYRPYGWSPFAQPGWVAPVSLRPEPRLILNPYVPVKEEAEPVEDVTAKSQMIINPFYVKGSPPSQGRLASFEGQ